MRRRSTGGGPKRLEFAAMPSLPEIGSSLPEVVLRTAIVYLFVVLALRLSGKREVGQMSVLELVVILVISDAVQNSMVGENTTLWGGLVAVVTLLALDFGLKALAKRSKTVSKAIEGEPRLLVRDGRLLAQGDQGGGSRDRGGSRRDPLARPRRARGRPARGARDRRLDQRHPARRCGAGIEPTAERRPHDLMRAVATLVLVAAARVGARDRWLQPAPRPDREHRGRAVDRLPGQRRRDARPAGFRRCRRHAVRPIRKPASAGRPSRWRACRIPSTSPGSTRPAPS